MISQFHREARGKTLIHEMRIRNGEITTDTEYIKINIGMFAKYKHKQQYKGNEPQDFYSMYLPKRQNYTSLKSIFH